jgi:hypothetical protein
MNDFLKSLKSDLLDRRLIPVLGLLAVVLVAAIAYAALGGGSIEPTTSTAPTATPVAKAPGIAVSQVKTADVSSSAETTSGSSQQTGGASRNPFAPLPGAEKAQVAEAASTTAPSSGGASSTTTESSSSSSGEGTSSQPEETKKASKPAKPKATQTVYHVAVLFGTAAPGSTTGSTPLTPFENLKRQQPLPSDTQALVDFGGVVAGGKSATFTLVGEAILRGDGKCLPNATQCQAIALRPGQTEELEYSPPGGVTINYQLQVVSITASKAKASVASHGVHGKSKTGLALLHNAGLENLPGLRYSAAKGALVFVGGHAYAARTPGLASGSHVSAWGVPLKG